MDVVSVMAAYLPVLRVCTAQSRLCLAKITVNSSIVSVDMDVVGVMAAYLPVVRVCTALSR